ncbi:MAG TPA: hypothetical protein VK850_14910, partial [Candidatus Binatia bacterium]|nr:hypothetical protein [Candidatus Binatia bacterium]
MKRGVLAVLICCLGAAVVFSQQKSDSSKKIDQPKRTPDVIFVPTPQDAVEKMLELAEVKKGDVV